MTTSGNTPPATNGESEDALHTLMDAPLAEALSGRHAFCPGCRRSLTPHDVPQCQECGARLGLGVAISPFSWIFALGVFVALAGAAGSPYLLVSMAMNWTTPLQMFNVLEHGGSAGGLLGCQFLLLAMAVGWGTALPAVMVRVTRSHIIWGMVLIGVAGVALRFAIRLVSHLESF